jgi:deoxyribose-phosphate aldolase
MTGKILPFTGETTEDIDADTVLENNIGEYDCVICIGYTKMGAERLVSSTGDSALMVWLLERAKKVILEHADLDDDEWEH